MSAELRVALERARAEAPELAPTIDLQLAILEVPEGPAATVPPVFVEIAAWRMDGGKPALDPRALALDAAALTARVAAIARAAGVHQPGLLPLTDLSPERARALAVSWLSGELDDTLAAFVLTHALRPLLRPLRDLALGTAAAARWTSGDCPFCGGPPDFAVLEPEGGARRLLCSRCDAEWRHARVGCPFCGDSEAAYYPAGDRRYRLYVCDACGHYLKTLDRREVWNAAPLAAERVLSIGLDVAAREAGLGAGRPSPRGG